MAIYRWQASGITDVNCGQRTNSLPMDDFPHIPNLPAYQIRLWAYVAPIAICFKGMKHQPLHHSAKPIDLCWQPFKEALIFPRLRNGARLSIVVKQWNMSVF